MQDKFSEKVCQTQGNFDNFLATNNEALPIVKSMRVRLIDYGNSIVKGLDVESWGSFGKYKEHLKWIKTESAGTDIVICRLTLPKKKSHVIAVEVSFDQYLLHWGFCVYRHKWLVEENENLKVLEIDELPQYVEACGFKGEARASDDSSVVSIRTLMPTGKRDEDTKLIRDNVEETIKGLLGDKKVKEFSPQESPSENTYAWGKMFNEYRRKELYDKPDKTPTLLEIARINENLISNVLRFFFDEQEPHPLSNLFFRALYELVRKKQTKKQMEELKEDTEIISVSREYTIKNRKRIDILIETNYHVVVIEAKIRASLYNDLAAYKEAADGLAKPDDANRIGKKVIGVVLHIEDNPLSGEGRKKAEESNFVSVTYKDLLRRAAELLIENNYSQLYHKNVDSLYLQLFFDLITTIENLSGREKDRRKFEEFLMDNCNGYWLRQAILNGLSFYQHVMDEVKEKLKNNQHKAISLKEWPHRFNEIRQANKRAGGEYADERKKYMLGRVIFYDTQPSKVAGLEGDKVAIDTFVNWESGGWVIAPFIRGRDINRQNELIDCLQKSDFFKLLQYKMKEPDKGIKHEFQIKSKGTKYTAELVELLQELITGIETGKPVK